jgi:hypothetical protein
MAKCPCCQDILALLTELQNENNDLRRENSDLNYRLYWKRRNTSNLQHAMLESNIWFRDLQCNCQHCIIAGYWDGDYPDNMSLECRFRVWLREIILSCDLTISSQGSAKELTHCSNERGPVYDIDCHIVIPTRMSDDITFGAKIWKAELGSAELKKLDDLFEKLHEWHHL